MEKVIDELLVDYEYEKQVFTEYYIELKLENRKGLEIFNILDSYVNENNVKYGIQLLGMNNLIIQHYV